MLDDEIAEFVNDAAKRLWRKLLTSDESQASVEYDFTADGTAAGARETLPTPAWRVHGLDKDPDTDRVCDVPVFDFSSRNSAGYLGFRVQGQQIILSPYRNAAGNYRLWYVPDYTPLADDADELPPALDRLDEFVVVVAAISVKDKREQDTSALTVALQLLEAEIGPVAMNRQSEPMRAPVLLSYSGLPGADGDDPARGPR